MFILVLATAFVAVPTPMRAAPDQTLGMALMSALVRHDGSLLDGVGAISSNQHSTGRYRVFFNRNVVGCGYVATRSHFISNAHMDPATISTAPSADSADGVWVVVQEADGTFVDRVFRLIVFCAK
jgi:hypothetical protein